jgi:tetrahydromethanopterin S-methyltransferase subunit H
MGLFHFETPQKVMKIGHIEVGGQPGERPPILFANMFQTGHKIVQSRKPPTWDKVRALEEIKLVEEMSNETGIPAIIGIVAPSEDEIKAYCEWFLSVNDTMVFQIDTWTEKARRAGARFVKEAGVQDRFNYNSISAWDPDIPDQVAELKECGIKSVILQPFDTEDKRATGRLKSLRKILNDIEGGDFESILVDSTTMNLPTQGFCFLANRMVKEEFGLPVGNAPANGSYMWRACLEQWGRPAFQGMDAAMHGIGAIMWSDWMAYGPTTGTRRVFAAVAAAVAMVTVMAWDEGLALPEDPNHPLNKHFSNEVEFMRGLQPARSDRLMDRQRAKGAKQRTERSEQEEEAGESVADLDQDLIPDSASAIESD